VKLLVRWRVLATIAVLSFLAGCGRVATEDNQIKVLADGEALRKDAAEYAKDQSVSLDEAVRRLELQDDIGKLDAELASNEPDTFGGLWIQHKPEFKVIVNTTGSAEKVADYARDTSFAGLIEVRKAAKTLKQLEAKQLSLRSALKALDLPSESSINVYTNQVELYVLDSEQLNTALEAAGKLSILEGVSVSNVASFMSLEVNIYAGNTMSCTSGFSVRDGNGLYGISTAGHCRDDYDYGSVPLRLLGQWYGSSDLQWHRHTSGSHVYKPWARDNEPTSGGTNYYHEIYDTANRPDQPIGALVCKYGITTGYTCGYINSKTITGFDDDYAVPTYIRYGDGNKNGSGSRRNARLGDGHQAHQVLPLRQRTHQEKRLCA